MSGWGSVSFSIGVGLLVGIGCGGRTDSLEGDYGAGADGAGAQGGVATQGGSRPVAGAGRPNVAGSGTVGGSPVGVAGTGPYGFGGYGTGGAVYPVGGYGGYGYAGSYPFAGASYGGYGFGGSFPSGGYGGVGPDSCLSCLGQSCSAELVTCFQDFGCLSIFDCMQSTGCQAFQCYSEQYCKGTIDQWGGPGGPAMKELLQTFTCALRSGCPCN